MAELLITCANSNLSIEAILKLLVRDSACEPYVDCNTNESWESLVKQLFSELADGTLALNVCACEGGL